MVTRAFILQIYQRASEGACRIGFTASRKIGGAVERNRVKRRLRALARQYLTPLDKPGVDYVLIGRQEALKRKFALMGQDLEAVLSKWNKLDKS
ncbi:MAG: hypothetical protein ACD_16C00059G0012 [uncultured bacterium]|nr:MAG: hypothetical protein ACD_16C00059G0012 [uncultured bacterium]